MNLHSYYYDDESLNEPMPQEVEKSSQLMSKKTGEEKVVEFVIGLQEFAVNLFETKEVINSPEITPIPNAPPYIRGMTNLRGIITTVIDLKEFLNVKGSGSGTKRERVIILDPSLCHKSIGIVVDDVRSVQNYRAEDIDLTDRSKERYQLGVIKKQLKLAGGKNKSDLVLLLDIKGIIQKIQDEL